MLKKLFIVLGLSSLGLSNAFAQSISKEECQDMFKATYELREIGALGRFYKKSLDEVKKEAFDEVKQRYIEYIGEAKEYEPDPNEMILFLAQIDIGYNHKNYKNLKSPEAIRNRLERDVKYHLSHKGCKF